MKSAWHKEGSRWVHSSGAYIVRVPREPDDYSPKPWIAWVPVINESGDDIHYYLSDAKRGIEAWAASR